MKKEEMKMEIKLDNQLMITSSRWRKFSFRVECKDVIYAKKVGSVVTVLSIYLNT